MNPILSFFFVDQSNKQNISSILPFLSIETIRRVALTSKEYHHSIFHTHSIIRSLLDYGIHSQYFYDYPIFTAIRNYYKYLYSINKSSNSCWMYIGSTVCSSNHSNHSKRLYYQYDPFYLTRYFKKLYSMIHPQHPDIMSILWSKLQKLIHQYTTVACILIDYPRRMLQALEVEYKTDELPPWNTEQQRKFMWMCRDLKTVWFEKFCKRRGYHRNKLPLYYQQHPYGKSATKDTIIDIIKFRLHFWKLCTQMCSLVTGNNKKVEHIMKEWKFTLGYQHYPICNTGGIFWYENLLESYPDNYGILYQNDSLSLPPSCIRDVIIDYHDKYQNDYQNEYPLRVGKFFDLLYRCTYPRYTKASQINDTYMHQLSNHLVHNYLLLEHELFHKTLQNPHAWLWRSIDDLTMY